MRKRISIYLIGLAITALGIALIIFSFIGAGPWETVAVGLTAHLGLTIGTWSIFSQSLFIILTWILEKRRLRIESIIPIVIRSLFLDFWIYIALNNIELTTSWGLQWISLICGIIFAGVGMAIYMEAYFPKTPIDGLMVALKNRFGWSLNLSRMSIEGTGVIIGFLLGGPVGLGTVVVALFLGKIIQTSSHPVKRILQTKPIQSKHATVTSQNLAK